MFALTHTAVFKGHRWCQSKDHWFYHFPTCFFTELQTSLSNWSSVYSDLSPSWLYFQSWFIPDSLWLLRFTSSNSATILATSATVLPSVGHKTVGKMPRWWADHVLITMLHVPLVNCRPQDLKDASHSSPFVKPYPVAEKWLCAMVRVLIPGLWP